MSALNFTLQNNLLPFSGEVYYVPEFFGTIESDYYFKSLCDNMPWQQEPVKIFGKEVMQPRLTAWFGEKDYRYAGITMNARPFDKKLQAIKCKVEQFAGEQFNGALLNLYRNGNDSMGWHRDNEKSLGINPFVASVSFGATRKFLLRNYNDHSISTELELHHGSLLLMRGETQNCWQHAVPKSRKQTDPRINITFRQVKTT